MPGRLDEKEPRMSQHWVPPDKAAELIGVSERAVWKRVRAGKMESRTTADGRREVRVGDLPTAVDDIAAALAELREQSEGGIYVTAVAAETKQRLGHAHSLELHRAQRLGLAGWLGVWCLLIAGAIGARYVSEALTERDSMIAADMARIKELRSGLTDAEADAERVRSKLAVELSAVRRDLADARARAAKATADARTQTRLAEILRADRTASAQKALEARMRADKAIADLREAQQRERCLETHLRDLTAPAPTATTKPTTRPTGETEEPDVLSP